MKQVAKSLVIVGAMLAAGSAAADMDMDFKPFIGVDYLHAFMPAKGTLTARGGVDSISAKSAFRSSFPGATVYVGSKFTDCFGIELGWDSSLSSKKKTVRSPSTSPFVYDISSKARREGYHADLVGFLPMDCWELFGSLGIGSVKMKLSGQSITSPSATAAQLALATGNQYPLSSKRKSVFRAGVGASYMFTDMFGARAKLGYEGTSALRVKYANGTSAKVFKDSTTLAVGLFVRF